MRECLKQGHVIALITAEALRQQTILDPIIGVGGAVQARGPWGVIEHRGSVLCQGSADSVKHLRRRGVVFDQRRLLIRAEIPGWAPSHVKSWRPAMSPRRYRFSQTNTNTGMVRSLLQSCAISSSFSWSTAGRCCQRRMALPMEICGRSVIRMALTVPTNTKLCAW